MADLAAHHAEALGEPVHLFGMSTAGCVAQQFAADHPALVDRLVLAATACRLGEHGRALRRRYADLVAAGQGAVRLPGGAAAPGGPGDRRARPRRAPARLRGPDPPQRGRRQALPRDALAFLTEPG
jgi:pimeloyl-ACP methyl ester carboxylesterase